jgi:hypothetical protein
LAVTKAKRTKKQASPPINVVRDSTFSRAVVDIGTVIDLGRDMEIACLQAGPTIVNLNKVESGQLLTLQEEMTEVVRLRLPWVAAVTIAMNILQTGASKDIFDVNKLISALAELNQDSGTDVVAEEH